MTEGGFPVTNTNTADGPRKKENTARIDRVALLRYRFPFFAFDTPPYNNILSPRRVMCNPRLRGASYVGPMAVGTLLRGGIAPRDVM